MSLGKLASVAGMHVTIERLQVFYDVVFRRPLIEVAGTLPIVAGTLHAALADEFQVRLADIAGLPGGNMAEIGLRLHVPIAGAEVELRLDRLGCRFPNLTTDVQFEVARRFFERLHEAVPVAVKSAEFGSSLFKLSAWLRCEGGADATRKLIEDVARPALPVSPDRFGASGVSYSYRAEVTSAAEAWSVTFVLERSMIPGSDLFLLLDIAFPDQPDETSVASRGAKAEAIFGQVLDHFGLSRAGPSSA